MNRLLNQIDHPIVFILFVTVAVIGMKALLEFGFKSVGWSGPAALVE